MPTDSKGGRSELERVLRGTFKDVSPDEAEQLLGPGGLGDYDSANVSTEGKVPGLTSDGYATMRGGRGRKVRAFNEKFEGLLGGIDRAKCPPWLSEDCLEVVSRLLEQTFRNFQLAARRPSHIDPPFPARPIDVCEENVSIPGAYGGGAFVDVACFTVPANKFRGEVVAMGHALESPAAWLDVEWRVTVDGQPYHPYEAFVGQKWLPVPNSPLCSPIHAVSRQEVCLQARSLSAATHTAFACLCGWYYPVRAESGSEIRSTLVD